MFTRFVHWLFGSFQPYRHRGLTFEDMDNMDVGYDEELTVFDLEKMMVDDEGDVVGMTALIDQEELTLSGGKLPARYKHFLHNFD